MATNRQRGVCATCHRTIWYSAAYGKWLHRKPGHAYQAGPGFSGGQHAAAPTREDAS